MSQAIIDSLMEQIRTRVNILMGNPSVLDVLKLHSALNYVEDVDEVPRTSLAQLFGLAASSSAVRESTPSPVLVKPGQYFDKTPLDAAKDYLTRRGSSAPLDDIISALKMGSCDPGAREKFGLSLARSTFNFVKLDDGLYDLLSRYPNVQERRSKGAKRKPRGEPNEESEASGKAMMLEEGEELSDTQEKAAS